jgi:hypothetical protein
MCRSVIRRVLIWLRLERIVIEWIALIALAFAALIAYNIVLATQPHHVLNVYLQYEEKLESVNSATEYANFPRTASRDLDFL